MIDAREDVFALPLGFIDPQPHESGRHHTAMRSVRLPVAAPFPLEDIAAARALLESNEVAGKVAVAIGT
ncbi:MAG: hypothetical protein MUD17_07595 [Gemmatimonadaceae bacterium]|nr:hypothetical protein [Gemmatimonadaceae bacterium]